MNKEILEKINIEINSITQSSEFIKLNDLTNEEDLFSILKIQRKELVHSDFLAKLLDPNCFDDLRDKFLIRFSAKDCCPLTAGKTYFSKIKSFNFRLLAASSSS